MSATILLIDDDEQYRKMLAQRLEGAGYTVFQAQNGSHGLELFRQQAVDVVITDLIMPEREGLETITVMRREVPDVKIIAISGGGRIVNTDTLPVALRFGARYAFAKPFEWSEMKSAIESLLCVEKS